MINLERGREMALVVLGQVKCPRKDGIPARLGKGESWRQGRKLSRAEQIAQGGTLKQAVGLRRSRSE